MTTLGTADPLDFFLEKIFLALLTMKLMGVRIDELTLDEARAALEHPQVIFTPNPEILLEAQKNEEFSKVLNRATLSLPDGHGLLLVSTLLQLPSKFLRGLLYFPALLLFLFWKCPFTRVFPEIIHGSDFMEELVQWAAFNKKSVFFLGGKGGVAKKTAEQFKKRFPSLKVAGYSEENPSEAAFLRVKNSGAEVIFVAYGAPKQEFWIVQYASKIPGLIHAMGVGGSFDFYSEEVKRAPWFLRKLGLEWLWRLSINPLQRFKRIWNAVVVFPLQSLFWS